MEKSMIYRAHLFDWGDTLMVDIPHYTGPMKSWPKVVAVEGARKTLEFLSSVSKCHLVTNAKDSSEDDIWEALARVNLDTYLSSVFYFRNIGFEKPSSEFFSRIISSLSIDPGEIAMIGDSFEEDILGAVNTGIFGYWYNPVSTEIKEDKMYSTIHSLVELIDIASGSTERQKRRLFFCVLLGLGRASGCDPTAVQPGVRLHPQGRTFHSLQDPYKFLIARHPSGFLRGFLSRTKTGNRYRLETV
jgi:putative hydrolase of the HAD superfamily